MNPNRGVVCPFSQKPCTPHCKLYLNDGECAIVVMVELNNLLLEHLKERPGGACSI